MVYIYIFLVLFFVFTALDIAAVAREKKILEHISKPLLMPLLVLYYIFGAIAINIDWLIVVALLCGCVGDVFLMLENKEKWFMYGMVAFLLGHIFYIISFLLSVGVNIIVFPIYGFVLLIPVIFILLLTFPKYKDHMGDLKIPVYIYMVTILTMHVSAILRLASFEFYCPCFFLVWFGSILFIFSDSMIAIDTFNKEMKIPKIRIYIMLTYILGQFLIVQGVLLSLLL
ncbi:MAG: lysoplasmalogenase [Candidatus Thorarchaeota archaeon]